MNIFIRCLSMLAFVAGSSLLFAEDVVVVVSAKSDVHDLDKAAVIDIFMGRYVAYPDGRAAIPLEVGGGASLKQDFYRQLVDMSVPKINSYWARLRFSGRQKPTIEKGTVDELREFIATNTHAIGYLYKSELTDDLKVVLELHE